jgi:hypothetical protein
LQHAGYFLAGTLYWSEILAQSARRRGEKARSLMQAYSGGITWRRLSAMQEI